MNENSTTPTSSLTVDEMLDTLTGFEEDAIAKAFGSNIFDLAERNAVHYLRALAFVHHIRSGQADGEAKKAAMSLTIKGAQEFFTKGPVEPTPEDPITEAGKEPEPSE